MHQLVYISTAQRALSDTDLAAILDVSRRNNRRDGVTGLLLFDGRRFLQALEGEAAPVEAAFERIRVDSRHKAAVMLSSRQTQQRVFGSWDMACERVTAGAGGADIVATVDRLVESLADVNTRSLFRSFARLERAA